MVKMWSRSLKENEFFICWRCTVPSSEGSGGGFELSSLNTAPWDNCPKSGRYGRVEACGLERV